MMTNEANDQIMQKGTTEWTFDLVPDPNTSEYKDFVQSIKDELAQYSKNKTVSEELFLFHVTKQREIFTKIMYLSVDAYLRTTKNLRDEEAKKLLHVAEELSTKASNECRFFHQWFIRLPQQKAYELAKLTDAEYVFRRMHDEAKYVLSEKEENIISLKDLHGVDALIHLYDTITASFKVQVDGKQLTVTQARQLLFHKDRNIRRQASEAIYEVYGAHMHVLFDIFKHVACDYLSEYVDVRGYENGLSVRAKSEDMPVQAIEALMKACQGQNELFQEFFALKAKILHIETLEGYDLLVPIGDFQVASSFEEAYAHVENVCELIGMKQQLDSLKSAGRIDSVFHEHKRSGAFCYPIPKKLPFVFMQYLGEDDDVFTLAHEIGHAIHFCHTAQKDLHTYDASLGICESVSTFFEELLWQKLYEQANREGKIALLCKSLIDIYSTIQRQVYISIFEKQIHESITHATNTDVNALWTKLQMEQFGSSVHIKQDNITWSYIPHIYHTPYYCYNYGVGMMLAHVFLTQFNTDKEKFLAHFPRYLSAGNTLSLSDTCAIMGIDITKPDMWKTGFQIARSRLTMLKTLLDTESQAK